MTAPTTTRFAVKNRIIVTSVVLLGLATLFTMAFLAPRYHLTEFWFNPFAAVSAVMLIVDLSLFIYFVRKPAQSEERIWLSVYLFITLVYIACELMQRLSANPIATLFWAQISTPSAMIAPILYLFIFAYTNQTTRRYANIAGLLIIASTIVIIFENWTSVIFVNDPKLAILEPWGWDYRGTLAAGTYVVALLNYTMLIAALVRVVGFRRRTRNPILRRQSLWILGAASIPIGGGVITDFLLPSIGVIIPSMIGVFTGLTAVLLIFAIQRYRFLTISPSQFSNTILDIMQESVVVTDTAFTILYVNPEAEKLLGINSSASERVVLISKISDATQASFKQAFDQHKSDSTGTVDIDRIDIMRAQGEPLPVRVRSSQLHLGSDLETYIIILTDITRELQTRSFIEHEVDVRTVELNQARAYLVSSINSLEQGFILLNPKGRIELVNRVAANSLEAESGKLTDVDIKDAVQALQWNVNLADAAHHVLETKRAKQLKAEAKDGTFFVTFITPIISGDHVLGATVVIEDVTEAKILERSKDEFFSIASHELRTPLTAIRGNMSIARQYFPDALKDDTFNSLITDTHDASVRLIEIVNDFLDSSKLEQGKLAFDLKSVDPSPIIEAVQKDLQSLLASQKNALVLDGIARLPKVHVDEARFRQIMYNLLSNAIKYTAGGKITVTADHDSKHLRIHVTDTGKGISPENQKLLFHKFQQAGSSILTRDNTKGTGLGLYISRLLAKNMHGDVELEKSEEGVGSTFVLTLPLAKAP